MTVRHIVAWKLAAEDPAGRADQAREICARLTALVGVVPSIRALTVGPNTAYPDTNWDIALVVDFDDLAGLEQYQVHPDHQDVVAYVRGVVSARAAVDFEL